VRFLVDASLSPSVVGSLNGAGHDAVHVGYVLPLNAPGDVVFDAAVEQGRVIVTADTDFGEILARWDGVAIAAAVLVLITAVLRAISFETPDLRPWVRWALLAIMAGATVYASAWTGPVARQLRRQLPGFDDLPAGAPARREFARLHAGARTAMTVAVAAGCAALFLS
jgi:predicted nuclease of predicted toxin-antitoxin system